MRAMLPRLSSLLFAFSAVALGLTLTACKAPPYPQCKKDKHCVAERGEKCVEGSCQNCKADAECVAKGPNGENWKCHEFLCQDPATIAGGGGGGGADGIGTPCTQTIECSSGTVCKAGACAACTEDFDCQPGTCNMGTGRCESVGSGGAGQCQADVDCAMDEICDMGACVFSGAYGGEGTNPCQVESVYFDFDSPQLKPEVQEQLKSLAECMKQQGGKLTILEAHADSRGTEEYNIMLTDRRGQAVKEFLQQLGVDPNMMQVISKGDLEATGTDDGSMTKDRRVDFKWNP